MTPLGARVTVLEGSAGLAATKKLLRSVFFKGLTAAIVEALAAARTAGCEDWSGTTSPRSWPAPRPRRSSDWSRARRHAVRRVHEMAAAELLRELGVRARIATASRDWLEQLAKQTDPLERKITPSS